MRVQHCRQLSSSHNWKAMLRMRRTIPGSLISLRSRGSDIGCQQGGFSEFIPLPPGQARQAGEEQAGNWQRAGSRTHRTWSDATSSSHTWSSLGCCRSASRTPCLCTTGRDSLAREHFRSPVFRASLSPVFRVATVSARFNIFTAGIPSN